MAETNLSYAEFRIDSKPEGYIRDILTLTDDQKRKLNIDIPVPVELTRRQKITRGIKAWIKSKVR